MSQPPLLITGATGAIGFEILCQLQAENRLENVSVLIRDSSKNRKKMRRFGDAITIHFGDVTNRAEVEKAMVGQEVVMHLAAVIPPYSEEHVARGYAINEGGVKNVVEAMEKVAPNAFLFFSSSLAVYGDRLKNPMISITDPPNEKHNDHYALAKIRAERIIKASKLNHCIFRLSAIMGIGNHKISGIMFDVPLETLMEIATVKDTARAFVLAIDKRAELNQGLYHLSGGESCRISYLDFLTRAFNAFGMGKPNFPDYAFAKQNFHCGYFTDADELENILLFRADTIDSYFDEFAKSVNPLQRIVTLPFAGIAKRYLLTLSAPYKAYKKGDKEKMNFYFGE